MRSALPSARPASRASTSPHLTCSMLPAVAAEGTGARQRERARAIARPVLGRLGSSSNSTAVCIRRGAENESPLLQLFIPNSSLFDCHCARRARNLLRMHRNSSNANPGPLSRRSCPVHLLLMHPPRAPHMPLRPLRRFSALAHNTRTRGE